MKALPVDIVKETAFAASPSASPMSLFVHV